MAPVLKGQGLLELKRGQGDRVLIEGPSKAD